MHPDRPGQLAVVARTKRAGLVTGMVATFIGRTLDKYGTTWPRDTTAARDPRRRPRKPGGLHVLTDATHTTLDEAVSWVAGRARCSRCQRSAATMANLRGLGCRRGRFRNAIARVGPYTFCVLCGAYGRFRAKGLSAACPRGAEKGRASARRSLLSGRDPVSNVRFRGQVTRVWQPTAGRGHPPEQGEDARVVAFDPSQLLNEAVEQLSATWPGGDFFGRE